MIVSIEMLEAKRRCLPLEARLNAGQGVLSATSPGPLVVVSDLFNYVRPKAKLFRRLWFAPDRNRLCPASRQRQYRSLHNTALSRYLLRLSWLMYGEDVIVSGTTGLGENPG